MVWTDFGKYLKNKIDGFQKRRHSIRSMKLSDSASVCGFFLNFCLPFARMARQRDAKAEMSNHLHCQHPSAASAMQRNDAARTNRGQSVTQRVGRHCSSGRPRTTEQNGERSLLSVRGVWRNAKGALGDEKKSVTCMRPNQNILVLAGFHGNPKNLIARLFVTYISRADASPTCSTGTLCCGRI